MADRTNGSLTSDDSQSCLNSHLFRRNKTVGAVFSYDALPDALKKECLVREKTDQDQDELKQRQDLVQSTTPAELGQIRGLSDIPLPAKIETLVRPSRRTLKSTKDKELQKRRYGQKCFLYCKNKFLFIINFFQIIKYS